MSVLAPDKVKSTEATSEALTMEPFKLRVVRIKKNRYAILDEDNRVHCDSIESYDVARRILTVIGVPMPNLSCLGLPPELQ